MFGNKNGSLELFLDKESYCAGDTVNGFIVVKCFEPINTQFLNLQFIGKEKVSYIIQVEDPNSPNKSKSSRSNRNQYNQIPNDNTSDSHGNHHKHYINKTVNKENYFYNNQLTIATYMNNYLMNGQYSYPFSFVLKQDLPPSFYYKKQQQLAKIRFNFIAYLTSTNLSCKKQLNIQLPLTKQPISLFEEKNQALKTYCCVTNGKANLQCILEKDAIIPNIQNSIQYKIDNSQGQIDIKKVKITLEQILDLNEKKKKISNYIYNDDQIGPDRYQSKEGNFNFVLNDKLSNCPSVNTKLIQNAYVLKITTNIGMMCNGCCGSSPSLSFPIKAGSIQSYYNNLSANQLFTGVQANNQFKFQEKANLVFNEANFLNDAQRAQKEQQNQQNYQY